MKELLCLANAGRVDVQRDTLRRRYFVTHRIESLHRPPVSNKPDASQIVEEEQLDDNAAKVERGVATRLSGRVVTAEGCHRCCAAFYAYVYSSTLL